jgi:hypothetical protein
VILVGIVFVVAARVVSRPAVRVTVAVAAATISVMATTSEVGAAVVSAATTEGVTAPVMATAHMAMTAAHVAAATATAVTDERDRISARRCAGIFQTTEAGHGGLFRHRCGDKSRHERRDRYCNQSTSHDLPLHCLLGSAEAQVAPHPGPGLINKILQIGMVPLISIKPL